MDQSSESSLKIRVLALLDQGNCASADALLRSHLHSTGESASLYHLLGLSAFQQALLPQALEYLHKAAALGNVDEELALCLAAAYCEVGEYEQAERYFPAAQAAR